MRGWSNKKPYIHLFFSPVDGTSRKQGLESLMTGKQGWCMGTMGCRQLTHSVSSALVYSVLFLTGYNHCIAPPESAISSSARSSYVALGHTPLQTRSRTIPVASAGPQGKQFTTFYESMITLVSRWRKRMKRLPKL